MSESFVSVGKRIYRLNYLPELRRFVIFLARTVIHRGPMCAMRDYFEADPLRAELASRYPYVYEQATRAFFYHRSTLGERIALIERHMAYMAEHFRADVCRKLYAESPEPVPLWSQRLAGNELCVNLFNGGGQRKEGLLSFVVTFNGRWLYQLMFWLDDEALRIGAMQGPHGDDARDFVKLATKAAHGLRPKNLIVQAAQATARALGLRHLCAVTNRGYYANNHVRVDRKLKTDFTDFWAELGGQPVDGDDRWYELPLTEPRKTLDEVPTRKRAVYKRRFAMLDDLESALPVNLAELYR